MTSKATKRKARLKLTQSIPTGPLVLLTVYLIKPGRHYYRCRIRDIIMHDEPEFTLSLAKDARKWPCPHDVACRVASELQDARGWIYLTRFRDGVPDLSAVYASTSRNVMCVWSTSSEESPVTHPCVLDPNYPETALRAIATARGARATDPPQEVSFSPVGAEYFPELSRPEGGEPHA